MNELSTSYQVVVSAPLTRPALLIEVQFPSGTVRLSSGDTVVYSGFTFVKARVNVTGIAQDATISQTGQLIIGVDPNDPNLVMGYALNDTQGFTSRQVVIYTYDQSLVDSSGILSTNDAVLIFSGVGDSVNIDKMQVSVNLISSRSTYLYSPRVYMNASYGFNHIQPKGLKIPWGSEIFVLE